MLDDSKDQDSHIQCYDNDFYVAIMEEDLGRIDNISKKHGSNLIIKIRCGGSVKVIHKGPPILPLHLAACYRRVKSMKCLLSAGADPELRDNYGRNALHLAIISWPCIQNAWPKSSSRFQAVVNSMQLRSEACLRILCDHGVDINAEVKSQRHQTALHLAVHYAALPAIHILASYGAEINAVDSSGMTALHMASGTLCRDIITSLIRLQADVHAVVTSSGNTPLHMAVTAATTRNTRTLDADTSCISELVEQGAVVDAVNQAGRTALQEACSWAKEEMVDLLLRHGADVNRLTAAGESCLYLFLDHATNVRNGSLLAKLLGLTAPLTFYNRDRRLPYALRQPQFSKQRDQLLSMTRQPRSLQDTCRKHIYLNHGGVKSEELRRILPWRVYDFVFSCWETKHITFMTEDANTFNNFFGSPLPRPQYAAST